MALLVWTMVGLALWHFTVFLPDNFYGGIVGAFCGALLGSIIFGLHHQPGRSRAQDDTDLLTGLEAIPGALARHGPLLVARRAPAALAGPPARSLRQHHRTPIIGPRASAAVVDLARFAAQTAHSRSPEPVSDVRRSLSAGPNAASAK